MLWLSLSVPSDFSKVMILFHTAQKMKSSIKDLFSKCDQIRRTLWICLHLLKESLIENLIFLAVPRFCASIQCPISLYQENIVYFLTRTFFPDSSPILGHLSNSLKIRKQVIRKQLRVIILVPDPKSGNFDSLPTS